MKGRLLLRWAVAIALLGVACFFVFREDGSDDEIPEGRRDPSPPGGESAGGVVETPELTEDLSGDYLLGYGAAASSPEQDLGLVKDVLTAFQYTIKVPDALPTAGNREIVQALLGRNAYKIRFLAPAFPFLNEDGELVDRWRTPLYFHFVEATEVGIRSAGPDRKMWTDDDVVTGEYSGPLTP